MQKMFGSAANFRIDSGTEEGEWNTMTYPFGDPNYLAKSKEIVLN
jgi:hypothetical protein